MREVVKAGEGACERVQRGALRRVEQVQQEQRLLTDAVVAYDGAPTTELHAWDGLGLNKNDLQKLVRRPGLLVAIRSQGIASNGPVRPRVQLIEPPRGHKRLGEQPAHQYARDILLALTANPVPDRALALILLVRLAQIALRPVVLVVELLRGILALDGQILDDGPRQHHARGEGLGVGQRLPRGVPPPLWPMLAPVVGARLHRRERVLRIRGVLQVAVVLPAVARDRVDVHDAELPEQDHLLPDAPADHRVHANEDHDRGALGHLLP